VSGRSEAARVVSRDHSLRIHVDYVGPREISKSLSLPLARSYIQPCTQTFLFSGSTLDQASIIVRVLQTFATCILTFSSTTRGRASRVGRLERPRVLTRAVRSVNHRPTEGSVDSVVFDSGGVPRAAVRLAAAPPHSLWPTTTTT
jgi:hypothetical protein